MSKNTLVAGLTLLSVLLATASSTKAELAPQINSLTIRKIERSNPQTRANPSTEQSNHQAPSTKTNNKDRRVASDSEKSMRYTRLGWEAHQNGEKITALKYYTQAVELDPTNGYAFMAAGSLLGKTKEGIVCLKAAAMLFKHQRNQEGYTASVNLLGEWGISEEEIATVE